MGLIEQHPAVCAIAGFWILSAIVGGMPDPVPGCSFWYTWAFRSLNILAANVGALMRTRFPRAPMPDECEQSSQTDAQTSKRPVDLR